jgi:tungstate transport system ATP-binding protein
LKAVEFKRIEKRYGDRQILNGTDVTVRPGECRLLCGNNGAGKSTLLRIMAGMEKPQRCQVVYEGLPHRWQRVKRRLMVDFIYLHQQPYLFEGDVTYNLSYPVKGGRSARLKAVDKALDWSGLRELAAQSVDSLSGGERQRVALARAWLRRPDAMLLDEPTANMDADCRLRTVRLLEALKREGVALIIATHDPRHFGAISDGMMRLDNGSISTREADFVQFPKNVTLLDRHSRIRA